VGDIISGEVFWPFWLRSPGLGPNHKREVFRSSFLLETRLEYESFQSFIGFLTFVVQKLWPKNNQLII